MNNPQDNNISEDALEQDAFSSFSDEDNSFEKFKKRIENRKKTGKAVTITVIVLLIILTVITLSFLVMHLVGRIQLKNKAPTIQNGNQIDSIVYEDNTVLYRDTLYRFNENITSILVMGIDRHNLTEQNFYGENGQADALFLVTIDTSTGKTVVTGLPRDAMTDIDVYSASGDYIGTQNKQLCLAYAYGDGREKSCESTIRAASRFLYGMTINSYFAIDLQAVNRLSDAVGGVKVTPNESFNIKDTEIYYKEGVSATLRGSNVLPYLQYRNDETADSSYLRMQRQIDYLTNFSELAVAKTKKDILFPITLFNLVTNDSVTDLNASKITYLSSEIFSKRNDFSVKFKSVDGTQTVGSDEHVEFYADEEKLYELVLELFYLPV